MSSTDSYAKGMTQFEEEDFDSIKRLARFEFGLFRRYLGPRILEVGAGWGRVTDVVIDEQKPLDLVAIEPSPVLFEKLQRRMAKFSGVKVQCAEVGALVEGYKAYFDASYSVHVMEHIEDDRQFIVDSLSLLRPGGRLIILVPALGFLYSDLDRNIGHFRRYDKKMIRALIEGIDVKIERLFYSNFLGVLASLYFIKFKKLEYQSEGKKERFVFLYRVYNRIFIPLVEFFEKFIPVPVGLNLTVVLTKRM